MTSNADAEESSLPRTRLGLLARLVAAVAAATGDHDLLLATIARGLAEAVGDACALFLVSDGGALALAALESASADFVRECRAVLAAPMPLAARPAWQRVVVTGESLLVPQLVLDAYTAGSAPAYVDLIRRTGIHSSLVVALRVDGRSIGLLVLSRFRDGSSPYDEADRDLAEIIGSHAGLAIGAARARAAAAARFEVETRRQEVRFQAVVDRGLETLRTSEERLRTVTEIAHVGLVIVGADHRYRYANRSYAEILRLPSADLVGQRLADVLPAVYEGQIRPRLERALAGERIVYQLALPSAGGEPLRYTVAYEPSTEGDERIVVVVIVDVTERERTLDALAQREEQLSLFIAYSPAALAMLDRDMRYLAVSRRWLTDYELSDAAIIGRSHYDVLAGLPARWKEVHRRCLAGAVERSEEDSFVRPDGRTAWLRWEVRPWHTPRGEIGGLVIFSEDITVRKEADAALRASEERFRELAETIRDVFWITNADKSRMLYVSPAYEAIWGRSLQSLYGSPSDWLEAIHPQDRERIADAARSRQASDRYQETYRIVLPDRTVRWIYDRAFSVRDQAGEVVRIVGLASDITRERGLEDQFRQAQKMEAVGRLAGGVAHDFNNLLSVVLGYADLLLADLKPGDPMSADVEEIREAGTRAAALTRQLLAFSRQSVFDPKVVDPRDVLAGMTKMLQRIVGEDIDLIAKAGEGAGRVRVDTVHFEQVIMNLVVNARDAMPRGGTLTIEVAELALDERPCVMVAVTDTGAGMDSETRAHIFEPFFTTKEKGKGTGLGLSMVLGIVEQSGGIVRVASEPARGTRFEIYLPRVDAPIDAPRAQPPAASLRGSETILLVEDEDPVRAVAANVLERQGYRVIPARHAGEALLLCERYADRIDLLLTDVVMPGMSGPALASQLSPMRPEMRVLFMSGYTDDSVVRHGLADPDVAFLQKPITPESLARKVRDVLDGARGVTGTR